MSVSLCSEFAELQSRSEGTGSHVSMRMLYLVSKGFWNAKLANWHAKQGNSMCSHESFMLHPGQLVASILFHKEPEKNKSNKMILLYNQ